MPYLVPTDASADNKMQFLQKSVPVKHILMTLGSDKEQSNLIVLDACRSNLFSKAFGIKTKSGKVLGGFDETNFKTISDNLIGTLIATATSSGDTASPEGERNSIYTKNFLTVLRTNPDIRRLLDDVTIKVLEETNGEQMPWQTGIVKGNFSFASFEPVNNPIPTITTPEIKPVNTVIEKTSDSVQQQLETMEKERLAINLSKLSDESYFSVNCSRYLELWRTEAQHNNAIAQALLASCYFFVKKDYTQAFSWYLKSANQNHAEAQYSLGVMYKNGYGVTQDYKEAINWYSKAANQGYAPAQNNLGGMYKHGEGVTQDDKEAINWYSKAANQGNASAQNNLGYMYDNGEGVTQDDKEAINWYSKAANQGNAYAQYNLGYMYYNGEGVTQDYKEAINWYSKAANQGYASAQFNLGVMYDNGEGVTQDDKEAINWYSKAANQGYAPAQNNLGYMYEHGEGVTQDDKEAINWHSKAANQGNASAQYNLGYMYEHGKGVTQDYKEAINWYSKAANQGNANAKKALARLNKKQ
jgi:TPR repeat protein